MKKNLQLLLLAASLFCCYTSNAQAPSLGTAAAFVLFTKTGAVTNTGISQVTGNVGTNTTGGAITGFGNVNGVMHNSDGAAQDADDDLLILYTQLDTISPTLSHAPLMGGDTLIAGIYAIAGNSKFHHPSAIGFFADISFNI